MRALAIAPWLLLAITGCRRIRFEVSAAPDNRLEYGFSGGGGGGRAFSIEGDGTVGFTALDGERRTHVSWKIDRGEARRMMQAAVDGGLFDLKTSRQQCCDLGSGRFTARIDGHPLEVSGDLISTAEDQSWRSIASELVKFQPLETRFSTSESSLDLDLRSRVELQSLSLSIDSGPPGKLVFAGAATATVGRLAAGERARLSFPITIGPPGTLTLYLDWTASTAGGRLHQKSGFAAAVDPSGRVHF